MFKRKGYRIAEIVTIPSKIKGNPPEKKKITQLSINFEYNYNSQKPIKVLDEKEIIELMILFQWEQKLKK